MLSHEIERAFISEMFNLFRHRSCTPTYILTSKLYTYRYTTDCSHGIEV